MVHFSRRAWLVFTLVFIFILGACQSNYTKQFQKSDSNYGSRTGQEKFLTNSTQLYGKRIDASNGHDNRTLRYNKDMSLAVSDMPGVFSAIVMETDRNAYAAVILDSTGTGMTSKGNRLQGDHIGTTRGMYNWKTGSRTTDPNKIVSGTNSYFTVENHRDLSDLFKKRVARTIRKMNQHLSEVHISANRDFVNQMSVYREEERRGVNLNTYLPDFNRLVKVQFE